MPYQWNSRVTELRVNLEFSDSLAGETFTSRFSKYQIVVLFKFLKSLTF